MFENKLTSPQKPNFYPASYLIMTVTSLLALIATTGLTAILVHYWINGVSDLLNDMLIFYWTASLAIVIPMHMLAYWHIRRTDKTQITTFSLRIAHGLLAVYSFITVASMIILGTWVLAIWANALLGTGSIDRHLAAATISLVLTIAWLFYVTRHLLRSRANESRPKYYAITTIVVSVVVLALSLAFPAMAYRDVARDFVRQDDLGQINGAIVNYVDEKDQLPGSLNDLMGLNDDTKQRLGDYEYSQQGTTKLGIYGFSLCATFARSNGVGHDDGLGFASHGAGKQCFARMAISLTILDRDIAHYFQDLSVEEKQLQTAIQNFIIGAKQSVDNEVTSIESFAAGQLKGLENDLEGLEANTGDLVQDLAAVQKFLHDLGCLFGGCK